MTWFPAGTWPTTSRETVRERRDEARRLVKEGVNPNTHKQAERVEAQRKAEAVLKDVDPESTSAWSEPTPQKV